MTAANEMVEAWRVIPHCKGIAIPLENARILWQRR